MSSKSGGTGEAAATPKSPAAPPPKWKDTSVVAASSPPEAAAADDATNTPPAPPAQRASFIRNRKGSLMGSIVIMRKPSAASGGGVRSGSDAGAALGFFRSGDALHARNIVEDQEDEEFGVRCCTVTSFCRAHGSSTQPQRRSRGKFILVVLAWQLLTTDSASARAHAERDLSSWTLVRRRATAHPFQRPRWMNLW